MSDGVHLLVPFANCAAAGCAEAARAVQLPHLQRLLARLAPETTDDGDAHSFSPPHERVLARAHGMTPVTDGLIPLAALQVLQSGRAPGQEGWAWITPAHWRVGRDRVDMAHPQELQLDAQDAHTLLAAMEPYFAGDGITLTYDAPMRWLARGELFRNLPTASLDRVVGRTIDPWMPSGDAARPLRRLQQEMQMLLYTLPLNDARQRGGLLPVNTFWASGSGAIAAPPASATAAGLRITPSLRDAALQGDWAGWAAAWQQLDARECAGLADDAAQGREVRLTLCGESSARTWSSTGSSLWRRLASHVRTPSVPSLLEGL
ncbi:MAG: hypothetical protein JWP41_3217 [Ramlibacter sp.]|nr:hypothetical protein [Ramlibacter sp.]